MIASECGTRERTALLKEWNRGWHPNIQPFWKWLELSSYDSDRDEFTLPNGEKITIEQINNRSAK